MEPRLGDFQIAACQKVSGLVVPGRDGALRSVVPWLTPLAADHASKRGPFRSQLHKPRRGCTIASPREVTSVEAEPCGVVARSSQPQDCSCYLFCSPPL